MGNSSSVNRSYYLLIYNYLQNNQIDRRKFNFHQTFKAKVELQGRETAAKVIINNWQTITYAYKHENSIVFERSNYPILVASGLSGLGKTRIINECSRFLVEAGVTGFIVEILVVYYNGHSLTECDKILPIEASFSWRILHRFMLESNSAIPFHTWFKLLNLPQSPENLDLGTTLQIIRHICVTENKIKPNEILNLFIGIDEFQSILKDEGDFTEENKIRKLLDIILDVSIQNPFNIRLYVMFAGTTVSVFDISGSSTIYTVRVPLTFLSHNESLAIARSLDVDGVYSTSNIVHECIYLLGGLPRAVTNFMTKLLFLHNSQTATTSQIMSIYNEIYDRYVKKPWVNNISSLDLIRLAAFAISNTPITLKNDSKICVLKREGSKTASLTWESLQDRGLIYIYDNNNNDKIGIPYSLLNVISNFEMNEFDNTKNIIPYLRLYECIKYLVNNIDKCWISFFSYE